MSTVVKVFDRQFVDIVPGPDAAHLYPVFDGLFYIPDDVPHLSDGSE